jgi:uncharacterized protein YneF (UPF0154 family)
MEKKNDEIDLLDLFLGAINILRTNFWLITSFFLLGISLGLVQYFTARKVFENKMVVSSGILTKTYGRILVDKINRHLSENNVTAVTQNLRISPETFKGISRIKIEDLTPTEETKESDRFFVTADTYNQNILPDLQKGIIYYFENNEFVKIRVDQNKRYLEQMLSKIDQEIKDMEEFKMRIFKGDFFQRINGNVMFDPTVVNTKILELTKEKISLQNAFALANSVQVIEGFTPFEKPSKPRLSFSLIIGAFIGFFFVGLIIAFKSIRKIVRMADAAKQKP